MFTAAFILCIGFVSIGATVVNEPTKDINQPAKDVTEATVNCKTVKHDASYRQISVCPRGFTHVASNDGCYKVVANFSLTWNQASLKCQNIDKDAHLVFITSKEEQLAVSNLLNNYDAGEAYKGGWWTGGQRAIPPHQTSFYWVGSYDTCSNCGIKVPFGTYTNWNTGEPNFQKNQESCVQVLTPVNGYRWNDYSCDLTLRFVCEVDMRPTCF